MFLIQLKFHIILAPIGNISQFYEIQIFCRFVCWKRHFFQGFGRFYRKENRGEWFFRIHWVPWCRGVLRGLHILIRCLRFSFFHHFLGLHLNIRFWSLVWYRFGYFCLIRQSSYWYWELGGLCVIIFLGVLDFGDQEIFLLGFLTQQGVFCCYFQQIISFFIFLFLFLFFFFDLI